jgi:hypothetical protein
MCRMPMAAEPLGANYTQGPTRDGPQSFGGAPVGQFVVDPSLLRRNRVIQKYLFDAADAYYAKEDLRWFFAYAHAMITLQINDNVGLFQRPNELLRLNMHFAEEFLRAVGHQEHRFWKHAFKLCQLLQDNPSVLVPEFELCAAQMASVHIHVDLAAAVREVGCVPPSDYGNMLILVNRGSLAAQVKLRGQRKGTAEALLQQLMAPLVNLDVKEWRNAVYTAACNSPVPDPETSFLRP